MRAPGAAALLLAALAAAPAAAQEVVIEGVVRDATGLVLPGVTVEARSTAPGAAAATAVSDGAGRFVIAALQPGTYDVTFTLQGFETAVRSGVAAGAGSTVTLEVALSVQLAEQVVVVGSRAQPRSVTASMVPIDAIPATEFAGLGHTDVGDQIRTLVPSYNVSPQPVGDAARIIRPANMRGLAPDHTLVLVNGLPLESRKLYTAIDLLVIERPSFPR